MPSTTTASVITLNTNEALNLITHSTSTNTSRITVQQSGTYLITTSVMIYGAQSNFNIWVRVNGTDLPRSNSRSSLTSSSDYRIVTVTLTLTLAANDYFEFVQSSTNTSAGLTALPANTSPTRPAIPSIIVTVNKISE